MAIYILWYPTIQTFLVYIMDSMEIAMCNIMILFSDQQRWKIDLSVCHLTPIAYITYPETHGIGIIAIYGYEPHMVCFLRHICKYKRRRSKTVGNIADHHQTRTIGGAADHYW